MPKRIMSILSSLEAVLSTDNYLGSNFTFVVEGRYFAVPANKVLELKKLPVGLSLNESQGLVLGSEWQGCPVVDLKLKLALGNMQPVTGGWLMLTKVEGECLILVVSGICEAVCLEASNTKASSGIKLGQGNHFDGYGHISEKVFYLLNLDKTFANFKDYYKTSLAG